MAIEASNCVYHDLAQQYPEICQFDLTLLATLTDADLSHHECMVKGGNVCRFLVLPAQKETQG